MRYIGREVDRTTLRVHHTGCSDDDGTNAGWMHTDLTCEPPSQANDLLEDGDATPWIRCFGRLGQDLAGNVGYGCRELGAAEVHTKTVAAVGAEFIKHCCAPDIATCASNRTDQALLFERVNDLRCCLLGKPCNL